MPEDSPLLTATDSMDLDIGTLQKENEALKLQLAAQENANLKHRLEDAISDQGPRTARREDGYDNTSYKEIKTFSGDGGAKNELLLDKWIRDMSKFFAGDGALLQEQKKANLAFLKLSGDADQKAATFQDIVCILKDAYVRSGQLLRTRQELMGMTVKSTMEEYIDRFNTRAAAIADSTNEHELIAYFIAALPSSISSRLTEEYCRGKVKLSDVQNFALATSESRDSIRDTVNAGLQAQHDYRKTFPSYPQPYSQSSTFQRNKFPPCKHCGKSNHADTTCWAKFGRPGQGAQHPAASQNRARRIAETVALAVQSVLASEDSEQVAKPRCRSPPSEHR